jgi:hypothetical protein
VEWRAAFNQLQMPAAGGRPGAPVALATSNWLAPDGRIGC